MPRHRKQHGKQWSQRWQDDQPVEYPKTGSNSGQDIDVGRGLRRLREGRNLTIRALAESSGLAVNTLSLIENGKTSPSVSTLQQLAVALNVPITAFFESDQPQVQVVFSKAENRPRATFESGIMEDLGMSMSDRKVEPFLVNLEPHTSSGQQPIVHTGFEFVYCLEGQVTYTIDNDVYILESGDSLLFEAHLPHRWENQGPIASHSLLVLVRGDEREQASERHFLVE